MSDIFQKLKLLNITNSKQLIEKDLTYWWIQKTKKIKSSKKKNINEDLIKINEIKQELEMFGLQQCINLLLDYEKGKNSNNFLKDKNKLRGKEGNITYNYTEFISEDKNLSSLKTQTSSKSNSKMDLLNNKNSEKINKNKSINNLTEEINQEFADLKETFIKFINYLWN